MLDNANKPVDTNEALYSDSDAPLNLGSASRRALHKPQRLTNAAAFKFCSQCTTNQSLQTHLLSHYLADDATPEEVRHSNPLNEYMLTV